VWFPCVKFNGADTRPDDLAGRLCQDVVIRTIQN
jgi:hypothetical protein